MLNILPGIGWLIDLLLKMSLAVPFWIIWTSFDIGEKYFSFLPNVYLHPGFWDCVGIFIVFPIIKAIFVPHLVSVSQSCNKD